ncbi:pentatricopeptide repeat-containing protein At4g18520, chloroplastic isoform X1 [Elaeis guineensis]|uniref:Pentatricopeptide repeat-containing protein At4g39530 n=1 Tax=Elaeis guineensis var. tenera TaxID=51953 RepID=A0A6J0PJN9_ELAGV|nr:pentatricopeptide repeat-containing protein At4g39530 [Elaeis guineensis]XP_029118775.1 pentatricopeptide repeat-containing protein At4g39530 [Elaeis guineensis]
MLRSIFHASLAGFVTTPSLHRLKPTQINPCGTFSSSHLNKLITHDHRGPLRTSGTMSDVLEILGPFDHIFPPSDAQVYTNLLRKCIRSKNFLLGDSVHAHLIKLGFESDLLVSNVLLDMYSKTGMLDSCAKLFDGMPERDHISWCTLISGYVAHGFDLEAYGLFRKMYQSRLKPNHFLISSALKGCSMSGILDLGVLIHGLVIKSGLGFDRFVEIGLVDMYAKCGSLDDALKMFYEIPVKIPVAWNAMISGYVMNGLFIEAVELCREMCRVGFLMDLVTLRIIASAASVLEMFDFCKCLHVYSIKIGLDADSYVVAEFVRLLTKLGEADYMGKLFSAVKKPDAFLYSLLISGYQFHGHRVEAVKLAEELLVLDRSPKQGALVTILNLCLCLVEGRQIHSYILKTGHFSLLLVGNALISMYIRFGEMVDANSVFHRMPECDVVSWTAIMAGLVHNLQFEEAFETFHAFRKTGIQLDQHSVVTAATACTGLLDIDKGKQIHALAVKLGCESSDFMNASMLHMYAKCGYIGSASRLFSYSILFQNLIFTNIMLAGYCWNSQPVKALELFAKEYHSGLIPDEFSYSTVLGACADIKSKGVGEQIHCHIVKSGFEFSDVIVGNAVISLYVRCGCISTACKFFHSMKRCNTDSYATLMLGYMQNRGSSEALRLFYQMQQNGLRANPVIFARILRGCADIAAIDLGKQIHASIIKMGLVSDVYIDNALVGMYMKSRDVDRERETLDQMSIRENEMCNSMIAGFSQVGDRKRNVKTITLFNLDGVKEDHHGYVDIMNFYTSAASQLRETSFHSCMVQNGLRFDVSLKNSRALDNSQDGLNKKLARDMLMWNSIYSESVKNECQFVELLESMKVEGIIPDHVIVIIFLGNCNLHILDERTSYFKSFRRSWIGGNANALCFPG